MRFRVLGPLRVWDGAGWSPVRAAQQRVVLAVLLAEAGRPVTKDRLVDEIWGDRPPPSAVGIVQDYVRQLRRLVGGGTRGPLVTRGPGYELGLADDELDAAAFDRLAAAGRRELAAGRLADGARQLADGLALWQGPALADVPASPTVATHAARLDRSRLAAAEERLGAQLDLGRHSEVLGELDRLIGEHPLQERLRAQLMLALYRCGRRSEALTAYRGAREVLVAELGLEPGRELRELQRAILADDPRLTAPTPFADLARPAQPAQPARPAQPDRQPGPAEAGAGRGTPAQLPAAVAAFTGRDRHLRELDGLLATGAAARPPVLVISTIAGAAGVGKTALAVHWARRVAGAFPDGQLHVNLRGHAAGPPVRPLEALAGFLHALGVPPADVPSEVEQAAALYRSVLAGKRVLVVLDNARHPDQVRPLLPSEPGCLVIVTSRDQLGGLVARDGAVRLALDVLTPAEARLLLARLLGADRVAAEPLAAAELAELCGRLPLALRIAAANLGAAPRTTIARYTSQLAAGDRLAALEVDGDPQASVRAAFELSYRDLPGAAQRLFRLLGLVPGPDLTPPAAAALAAVPVEQAARLLDRLAAAHLVEHRVPGRYGCHDLLRRYAAERAGSDDPAADRQAALGRLVDFYLHSVAAAAERLYPHLLRPPLDRPAVAAPASF
ncbi:MAG TPA: AfsR/SARP family transcriptional regulator, partial [Mycobacteriales bacterium]|nr:AfsR/SARP family transcriptional regulator [Mycobacteriales bacterium]